LARRKGKFQSELSLIINSFFLKLSQKKTPCPPYSNFHAGRVMHFALGKRRILVRPTLIDSFFQAIPKIILFLYFPLIFYVGKVVHFAHQKKEDLIRTTLINFCLQKIIPPKILQLKKIRQEKKRNPCISSLLSLSSSDKELLNLE
jgi:hypothetical protein